MMLGNSRNSQNVRELYMYTLSEGLVRRNHRRLSCLVWT